MAASLDGYIAREDGRVDWMDTSDAFAGGVTLAPDAIAAFLSRIDCYVMGARTYELALRFEAQGLGWAYGDTPTVVLSHRELPRTRESVRFVSGNLAEIFHEQLRGTYADIWVAGGSVVASECLSQGLADELRYTVLPVVLGRGIPFFSTLNRDVPLHLTEVTPYANGTVELRYDVRAADA